MKPDVYNTLFSAISDKTDSEQKNADSIVPAYERLCAYRKLIRNEMRMQNAAIKLVRMLEDENEQD